MDLPLELFIALRYLLAKRKQAFISLISAISTLGVMVGVMAVLIALALMTGLQDELRDRIVGSAAQVYVFKAGEGGVEDVPAEIERLRQVPHVVGAAPVIIGQALVSSGQNNAFVSVKGIDPALEPEVTDVSQAMEAGSLDALNRPPDAREGIIIGRDLATKLGAFVGDSVTVITPEGVLTPFTVVPRVVRLDVVGVYKLGLYEFDSAYGFVSLAAAKHLFNRDRVDFIELKVDDIYRAPEVAADVTARLGPTYLTQDWSELNESLFSALWVPK